jgi:hypothetical protein
MFVPPEQRRSWYPPPESPKRGRSDTVLLFLIGLFLFSMLLAPIGGNTVVQALVALLRP